MSAFTETLHRPGRRLARLDPFEPQESAAGVGTEADTGYGCVEWYVYGERAQRRRNAEHPLRDASSPRGAHPH
jgi:hypothetical protein